MMALRICLVLLGLAILGTGSVLAQSTAEEATPPVQVVQAVCPPVASPAPVCPVEWGRRSQFAIYGWLSGINADVTAGEVTRPIDVSFSDILSNLDMTFMGYFETANERRGLFLDLIYVRLSGEESFPDARLDWKVTQWLAEGGFLFYGGTPERGLDGLIGARYISLDNDLSLSPLAVSASAGTSSLMPIIGGRYRTPLSPQWSGTLEADIGGYGGDSTWQALLTLRYRLSEKTVLGLGYRYLHLDFEEGSFGFDGAMSGPLVGVGWVW